MQSLNKKTPTASEKRHIERIKALPCGLCFVSGPSECHEIKQGQWMTSIPLCTSCHRDYFLGLHGQKRMWKIMKMDELDVLALVIKQLLDGK